MTQHESPEETQAWEAELKKVFPAFSKWKQLYGMVLGELVLLIILFYLFSQAFA